MGKNIPSSTMGPGEMMQEIGWLALCPPKGMFKSESLVPVKVTLLGKSVFADVMS